MIALQYILDAINVGGLYALMALGIGLIFGIMRLINFAHGEMVMAGGYAIAMLVWMSPVLVIALSLVFIVLMALLIEQAAFRPLRGKDPATLLVASFAVSYFLQNLTVMIFGARPLPFTFAPGLGQIIEIGGLRFPLLQFVSLGLTVLALAGLMLLLKRTAIGIQLRAAAEDVVTARLSGINVNRVVAFAFAMSAILAWIVSMIYSAQIGQLSPTMGVRPLIIGFVATVSGRTWEPFGSGAWRVCRWHDLGVPRYDPACRAQAVSRGFPFRDGLHNSHHQAGGHCAGSRPPGACVMAVFSDPMRRSLGTAALLIIGVAVVTLTGMQLSGGTQRIITSAMLMLIIVVGSYIFIGNSGVLSFGHIGFLGIGAYTSAWVSIAPSVKAGLMPGLPPVIMALELAPIWGAFAGGLLSSFVALLFGLPLTRLAGIAASIGTFAMLVILYALFSNWTPITGGQGSLYGLPIFTNLPVSAAFAAGAITDCRCLSGERVRIPPARIA